MLTALPRFSKASTLKINDQQHHHMCMQLTVQE